MVTLLTAMVSRAYVPSVDLESCNVLMVPTYEETNRFAVMVPLTRTFLGLNSMIKDLHVLVKESVCTEKSVVKEGKGT